MGSVSAEYIEKMLGQFKLDPASSDHQRGYEAALHELLRVAKGGNDGRK